MALQMPSLETLYFVFLPVATVLSHLLANGLTRHGHVPGGISKNNYKYFYAYGVVLSLVLPVRNIYPAHLMRRLVETGIFKYSPKSRMSLLQFAHGVVYYTLVCVHLRDKHIGNRGLFALLNVAQLCCHYCVFVRKTFVYSHYVAEVMIYGFLLWEVRTAEMLFNLLYVVSFVASSVSNRCTCRR